MRVGKNAVVAPVDSETLAATVTLAMVSAALLAIPIAWIYTLTRARRGYQQSVVQLLIILPVVVAGIVVLVKYSLALAFSLGGIAAAVRFRNTLDDSKDAVYVFLVTGLGIAAAVELPVALVISVLFNVVITALWLTDFGRTPVALEGAHAERRLARARQLARTGTFVARIDDEVLKNMTSEQLEGVARRAWSRAREHNPDGVAGKVKPEGRVIVRMRDAARIRPIVESQLDEATKRWSVDTVATSEDGTTVIHYTFVPKKSKGSRRAAVDVAGRWWCRAGRRRTPVVHSNPDPTMRNQRWVVLSRIVLVASSFCAMTVANAQLRPNRRRIRRRRKRKRPRTAPRPRRTAAPSRRSSATRRRSPRRSRRTSSAFAATRARTRRGGRRHGASPALTALRS